jgi:Lrp/AsnC family leucine-responsive transcriptional regulator
MKDQNLDDVDMEILQLLQSNARMTNVEIAHKVQMAPSAVFGRIRRLQERGFVQGFEARLNARKLGFDLLAYVFVREDKQHGVPDTLPQLLKIPEIQAIHHVAGEDCFLLRVCVSDTAALGNLVREQISRIKGVAGTRTIIVLDTKKDSTALPLEIHRTRAVKVAKNRG